MSIFKNAVLYRIGANNVFPSLEALEGALQKMAFTPCAPTQQNSAGFVSPRGEENAPLAESIGAEWILQLKVERKSVPAGAVKAELDIRCAQIFNETGRKPGRKAKQEMKEEIVIDMMPRAFSKFSTNTLWIDRTNGFLVVGAGSHRGADASVEALVNAMAEAGTPIALAPLSTQVTPATSMSNWLIAKEAHEGFYLGREVELKSTDEEKSVVRYARHALELDEIARHITEGKAPTRLALEWDGRIAFVLSDDLTLKKITTLKADADDGTAEGFDGDVALATAELAALFPKLIEALGGELVPGAAEAEENGSANAGAFTAFESDTALTPEVALAASLA